MGTSSKRRARIMRDTCGTSGLSFQMSSWSRVKSEQEKMRGQRGRLRALAGICHVHESYFWTSGSLASETSAGSIASLSGF